MNTDDEMDKALELDRQKLEDLGADPGPRYEDLFPEEDP